MKPRVPGNAIQVESMFFELSWNFCEGHLEATSQEVNMMLLDRVGQPLPEVMPDFWPHHFHGAVVPVDAAHIDYLPGVQCSA